VEEPGAQVLAEPVLRAVAEGEARDARRDPEGEVGGPGAGDDPAGGLVPPDPGEERGDQPGDQAE
jgi:hypothetical protein